MDLIPVEHRLVNFDGAEIMAVKASDGKVYAGVRWLCGGLGLTEGQYQNQTRKLSSDPVLTKGIAKMQLPTNGGPQEFLVISLDYLPLWLAKINANIIEDEAVQARVVDYQLRAKDVLAEAFAFQAPQFNIPKDYAEALRLAANQWERIQELEPKAEFHDRVAGAVDAQSIRDVAKVLGTGQNRMFSWLRGERILMADNRPYQDFLDAGYFKVIEQSWEDRGGETHLTTKTLVTGKGLTWLQKRFHAREAGLDVVRRSARA